VAVALALASGGPLLELAGIGYIRHTGRFYQLLTKATPAGPLATKALPHKPSTVPQVPCELCVKCIAI